MSYYFSKTLDMPFAAAIEHVTKKLAGKGFGILTRIDVQHTMKVKLGVDFKPYMGIDQGVIPRKSLPWLTGADRVELRLQIGLVKKGHNGIRCENCRTLVINGQRFNEAILSVT